MKRKSSSPQKKRSAESVKKSWSESASTPASQIEELHNLARELIREQEEQRLIVSRELHDNIVQVLSAASTRLALTGEKAHSPAVINELDQLRQDLLGALQHVRQFARDLRPATMDGFCLCKALEKHLAEMRQRVSLDLAFECQVLNHNVLDNESRTQLFRLAQEALHNVEMHSGASQARIRLQIDNSTLQLEISDNGCSIDPYRAAEAQENGHIGLMTMRERAELLGGELRIHSSNGSGTTVLATIPLNGRPDQNGDKKP